MLPALIPRQPLHCAMLRVAASNRLAPPDDGVVQEHASNHQQDHRNVEARHKLHDDSTHACRLLRVHVNLAQRKTPRHSFVTLPAGCIQIGAIDG